MSIVYILFNYLKLENNFIMNVQNLFLPLA